MKHLFVILLITLAFFSCTGKKSNSGGTEVIAENKTATLVFKTDKRLEVLYIVFLFSDYPVLSRFSNAYRTDALRYFDKYKTHKAVLLAKALVEKGFVADYAVNWLFQHTEFPEFKKRQSIGFPFEVRSFDPDTMELFREELLNFYTDADCERFLNGQKSFFEKMVLSVEDSFSRKDIIDIIEAYFGIKKSANYYVLLSPLMHSGGFAIERTDSNELYALVGPSGNKGPLPGFDNAYVEQDMVIHEFSHNYANAIVDKFMEESRKFEKDLFPLVQEQVEQEGYSTWESFMHELIVRSTTVRIVESIYGKQAANTLMEYEKSVGFAFVADMAEELKAYELQRDQYATLEEFYPRLLKRLEEVRRVALARRKSNGADYFCLRESARSEENSLAPL
jgi:hypothetical protein